jgi:transposase
MHRLQELVRLHRQGLAVREVARLLRMSPNTERQYRQAMHLAGLLEGSPDEVPELEALREAVKSYLPNKPAPQQASSVEMWCDDIVEMAQRGAKPKAIYDALRLKHPDFQGSLYAIKRFYRRWRKARGPDPAEVAIPVETASGEVAQVDFGYVGYLYDPRQGRMRRAWFFVMVLAHSRHIFAKIVFDQKTETWLQLHVEAFAEFGGVPAVIVPDNLKAAVIRSAFGIHRDKVALNRSYRELARHYGFVVDPTPPRDPRKKGKSESAVKYVKSNFLTPRAFEDIDQAQAELKQWRFEIAGQRVHGTTGRKPLEVFEEEERSALRPLPMRPFVPVVWKKAKVHPNCHIVFQRREYSVHWTHVGKVVWLRATPESVAIYVDDQRVRTHDRRDPGGRSTVEADLPEHRRDLRHRSRGYWMRRARLIDETVEAYIVEVFAADEVLSQLRTVQAMVTHLEKFPRDRAIAACERARFYGNHSYRDLKNILRKGLDLETLPIGLFTVPETTSRPRFSRAPTT